MQRWFCGVWHIRPERNGTVARMHVFANGYGQMLQGRHPIVILRMRAEQPPPRDGLTFWKHARYLLVDANEGMVTERATECTTVKLCPSSGTLCMGSAMPMPSTEFTPSADAT